MLTIQANTRCLVRLYLLYTILQSFHSRNEHIFGFLANIVVISSRVIFFLTLSGYAMYHFCNRSFPCRLKSSIKSICANMWRFRIALEWLPQNYYWMDIYLPCPINQTRDEPKTVSQLASMNMSAWWRVLKIDSITTPPCFDFQKISIGNALELN